MYIETQFCFEADIVLAWERDVRAAGNALPIALASPARPPLKHWLALRKFPALARPCGLFQNRRAMLPN